jgi:hypothetical protein
MSKRSGEPQKLCRWRIVRIKGTPASEVGTVEAVDAHNAIQVAIEKYGITKPEEQRRLAARPVK